MDDKEYLKELGKNISLRRKELNLTQTDFAKLTGLHRTAVSRIESGNTNCSVLILKKIAEHLNTTSNVLMIIDKENLK